MEVGGGGGGGEKCIQKLIKNHCKRLCTLTGGAMSTECVDVGCPGVAGLQMWVCRCGGAHTHTLDC